MAAPTFQTAGAIAGGTGTSLSPAAPASVQAGDILILAWTADQQPTISAYPAGFAEVFRTAIGGGVMAGGWGWKRADGTEGGASLTVTRSAGTMGWAAVVYVIRGAITTGTPYESEAAVTFSGSTAPSSSQIDTLGPDRLVVALLHEDDNIAMNPLATFVENSDQSSTAGTDIAVAFNSKTVAVQGTVASQAMSPGMPAGENFVVHTFALIPAAGGQQKTLAPALETGAAQPVAFTKTIHKTLAAALETGVAQALSAAKTIVKTISPAVETGVAAAVSFSQAGAAAVAILPATETGGAQPLTFSQGDPQVCGDATPVSHLSQGYYF